MSTLLNGRTVRGIIQGDAVPQTFLPELLDLHRAGKFPVDRLVRYYPFEEIEQAFEDSRCARTIKPILRISQM